MRSTLGAPRSSFYLFTLRLLPSIPFSAINLLMGLTQLPVRTFYWVSQVGMLATTLMFVHAGTQLYRLHSLYDILSLRIIGSLMKLGLVSLLTRWIVTRVKAPRGQ
jgi:uncharacterized membrane protein YdjX (TVP38/TMEM64 family)